MITTSVIETFKQQAQNKVIVAGYGSLLSEYSRRYFNQIDSVGIAVTVKNWERAWITRSQNEQQTYVGAIPNKLKTLNAQLIALTLDDDFTRREQDYRFTPLLPEQVQFDRHTQNLLGFDKWQSWLISQQIYICETLSVMPTSPDFPVNLSYVNTCVQGCFESGGLACVDAFFDTTSNWQTTHFNDDLSRTKYPRSIIKASHGVGLLERISQYK